MPAPAPPRATAGQGLRVLSVRGIPLYVSPLTLVFAGFVGLTYSRLDTARLPDVGRQQVWLMAAVTALVFLLSLALHEGGHALVARLLGFEVLAVTLYGFAGLTQFRPEPRTPRAEASVAAAGPAVNLLLGLLGWLAYRLADPYTPVGVLLLDAFTINLLLGVFNLAPGLPLDGGRVLLAGIWGATHDQLRATRGASYGGLLVAAVLAVVGVVMSSGGSGVLWFLTAGVIGVGAWQSLQRARLRSRLPGLSAGRLARRALPVDADLPLGEALRRAVGSGSTAVVLVDGRGSPLSLMNGAAADAVPPERRAWTSVADVARRIEPGMVLDASLEGEQLLAALEASPASEYLVVEDGQPVGVLVAVDLAARLSGPSPRGPVQP